MITLQHHLNFGLNFSRSTFCDAKLKTKHSDGCIPIHRNILAGVSKKLEKRFGESLDSSEPIVINNVDFDVLNKIISYVYTGEVTFAGEDMEYEDFCDGISLLKIDLGNEDKISPEINNQTIVSNVIVKTECEEDNVDDPNDAATSVPTNSAPIVIMSEAPSNTFVSSESGVPAVSERLESSESSNGISEGQEFSVASFSDLSNDFSANQNILPFIGDINENQASLIHIRTDLYNVKDKSPTITDDIEVLEVKEFVELFLQELSLKISKSQIKNYFSSFGDVTDVDLIERLYGVNSGLGVVKMVIDENNKRKVSELRHQINQRCFKVLLKEDIVSDDQYRLNKRFGDNRSKLRLKGISRAVTHHDLKDFFGRRHVHEVFVDGEVGFIEFYHPNIANEWNGATITVRKDSIKVYRCWKDSSRSMPVSRVAKTRQGRVFSVSPIRNVGSRSRSRRRKGRR